MSAISEQYALALFGLAREQDSLSDTQTLVTSFVSVYLEQKAFFDHPGVGRKDKIKVLSQAFTEGLFTDFLGVLIENNRLNLIPDIAQDLDRLIEQQEAKMSVTVTSAKPLNEARQKQIQAQLQKQYNRHVILDVIVDESLIGGLRYTFDGNVLNDTVTQTLRSIQQRLVK